MNLKVSGGIRRVDRIRKSFDGIGSQFETRNGITRGRITNSESTNQLFSSTLTYKTNFNKKHKFDALLGFDFQDVERFTNTVEGSDFPEPNAGFDNLGAATEFAQPFSFRETYKQNNLLFYKIELFISWKIFCNHYHKTRRFVKIW